MNSTIRISARGTMTLPKPFRKALGVDKGGVLMVGLAAAVGAKCTHLWTSDRTHFGVFHGQLISGVRIVSSIMLADEVKRSWQE